MLGWCKAQFSAELARLTSVHMQDKSPADSGSSVIAETIVY